MLNRVVGIAIGLLTVGLLLTAWQGLHCNATPEGPSLTVDNPHRDLGDVAPEREYQVDFVVRNRSKKPLRVIGAEYS